MVMAEECPGISCGHERFSDLTCLFVNVDNLGRRFGVSTTEALDIPRAPLRGSPVGNGSSIGNVID